MKRPIKLMVSCGSGIATSTHAASIVQEYMNEHGIPVSIMTCSVNDLANRLTGCDVILSTAQVAFDPGIPVFDGLPLLTGVGEEELLEDLQKTIQEITEND